MDEVNTTTNNSVSSSAHAISINDVGLNESDAEVAWVRRCLPIFIQPQVDVDNENELVKVYYRFERDDTFGHLNCKLCIILAGEASYNRSMEKRENLVATFFYRTFNRKTYKRTADINYMEFRYVVANSNMTVYSYSFSCRNVNLSPNAPIPWTSIASYDHGGSQSWSQGEKGNVCCWFSLMHHYKIDSPFAEWTKDRNNSGVRPHIYLNTCNHMIGEKDNNPKLEKHFWIDYSFQEGDAEDALKFAVDHIPTKWNLYSIVCFWKATNGGAWCDRLISNNKLTHSRDSSYMAIPVPAKSQDLQ